MIRTKTLLNLVLLLLFHFSLTASHIVGGDISYKFVQRQGNKATFHFTMKMYRDRFTPTGADFDLFAPITVFLATPNQYYFYGNDNSRELVVVPMNNRRILMPPTYPCLEPPTTIGVDEANYEWNVTLADTNYSYIISYQRCCRNGTIANIYNPYTTGTTFTIEITPEALRSNNSSPKFKSFPPILICGGEPLVFDHSASDTEGDALVYSFCNPIIGGSEADPFPSYAEPPPYQTVRFRLPTFTYDKPMAGNPVVKIDSRTGIITGTPDVLGQYVVSVCVEEYRNGRLISKIFRDFQFNVVSCKKTVIAAVEADSVSGKNFFLHTCDVSATLTNKSIERANIFNFVWQFNQNGDTIRYSDWHPTIQFRDSGVYKGQLILNPNSPCSDTATLNITVSRGIKPDFTFKYDTCVAGEVSFTNKTRLGSFPLKEIVWDYSDGKRDTNQLTPTHQYENPGLKPVKLFVKDKSNCKKDTTINLMWQPAPPILIVEPDKFTGCTPAKVFFNNKSKPIDSTYNITWNFGDGEISKAISPTHTFKKGGDYTVNLTIVSPIGCRKDATFTDWIKIRQTTKADFAFSPKKVTNLAPSVFFTDKSEMPVAWHWDFVRKGYSSLQNPNYKFQDTGSYVVKLTIRNPQGCLDSISKNIYVEPTVTFFMPNAFTPNDDSTNDEFKGKGFTEGMKYFRLVVWNRWGEKIFETTHSDIGWNGLVNNVGRAAPEGVYLYELHYTTPNNQEITKKDFVTLVR